MAKFIFLILVLVLPLMTLGQTYLRPPALIEGTTTTAKAGGTTALTAASQTQQSFTGTSVQIVDLPDADTLDLGRKFYIYNAGSAGNITVEDFGNNTIGTVYPLTTKIFYLSAKPDSNGTWGVLGITASGDFTGILPIANGGTNTSSIGASGNIFFSSGTAYTSSNSLNWNTTNGQLGIGTSSQTATLTVATGNRSGTPSSVGTVADFQAVNFTDNSTAASGTVGQFVATGFRSSTLNAANASVTTSNAANTRFGYVIGGTNETITNSMAMDVVTANVTSAVTNSYGLRLAAATGATNNYAATFTGGNVGIGTATPAAQLNIAGSISAPAWTSNGAGFVINAQTFTDTTSTGSPSIVVHSIGQPTVAATNAITPTLTTLRIAGAPVDGANVTSSSKFAVLVASGNTRYAGFNLFGTNSGTPVSVLQAGGNQSDVSWGTTGKQFAVSNGTLTDTTGSGTIATRVGSSFNNVTYASTNAVTLTNAANLYISGAPSAGTNTSITNSYALDIASLATSGTPTNTYGLRVSASSGGTNNYAATISGNVGMGAVTDPQAMLDIAAGGTTVGTNEQLQLRSQRAAIVSGNLIAGVSYRSNDTTLTAPGSLVAYESAVAEATHTASVLDTGLAFGTTSGTTLSEKMRLSAAGNLGIGTVSPASLLNVVTPASNSLQLPIRVQNPDTTASGSAVGIGFKVETGVTANQYKSAIAFERLASDGRGTMHFLQNNASGATSADLTNSVMAIDRTGNVGIGITAPTAKLMVDGSADAIQTLVQGHSTQTNDIFVAETSAGTDIIRATNTNAIIRGTQTNDNAAAGYVGEYIECLQSTNLAFPTTNQYGDLCSVTLTAGDWDLTGTMYAITNGATVTQIALGLSTTSGNSSSGITFGINGVETAPTTATGTSVTIPVYRVSVSGNTTYYLKYLAQYTVATPQGRGRLSARRMR